MMGMFRPILQTATIATTVRIQWQKSILSRLLLKFPSKKQQQRRNYHHQPLLRALSSSSSYNNNNKSTKQQAIEMDLTIRATNDWRVLLDIYQKSHQRFNNRNWASLLNQLKKIKATSIERLQRDERFERLLVTLGRLLVNTTTKDKNRHRPHNNYDQEYYYYFDPQNISNIAHALAKLRVRDATILNGIADLSEWLVWHGTPQSVANIAWALATLQDYNNRAPPFLLFFASMNQHAQRFVQQQNAKPQEIANAAWACATVGYYAPRLFQAIDETASMTLVRYGKPQEIANTAWACGTLQYKAARLFGHINECPSRLLKYGTPQAIANTLWACAKLQYHVPSLLNGVDAQSESIIQNGKARHIANVALAFAELDFVPSFVFEKLTENIKNCLRFMNCHDVCNILYSLAVLDLPGSAGAPLLRVLWDRAVEMEPDEFVTDGLRQLSFVQLYASAYGITLKRVPSKLKLGMAESIKEQMNTQSKYEDGYSYLLNEIGFRHEREVSLFRDNDDATFLAIDFANKEQKIAVEFDGEFHFLTRLQVAMGGEAKQTEGIENGPTKSKRRLLQKLGWEVVSIPYHDDIAMEKEKNAMDVKREYLRNKLARVGGTLSPLFEKVAD